MKNANRVRIRRGLYVVRRGNQWYKEEAKENQQKRTALRTDNLTEALQRVEEPTPRKVEKGPRTLGLAAEKYLLWYGKHNRPSSHTRTKEILDHFVGWMGFDAPLTTLTRERAVAYRDMRSTKVSGYTTNAEFARVAAFANWLRNENIYEVNLQGIRRLPVRTTAKDAPTPAEVQEILGKIHAHPWICDWILLLAETGMRPQEALAVRGIDYKDGLLKIRSYGDWRVKTAQDRGIELNARARAVCEKWKEQLENKALPLFPDRKGNRRGPREAFHIYKNYLKKVKYEGTRWAPYDFRHFFCSQAAAAGWPIEKLAAYVGHATVSTLERWYLDKRALRRGAPPVLT